MFRKVFWFIIGNIVILGYVGMSQVGTPLSIIGQFATITYFIYIILLLPLLGFIEATLSILL